MTIPNHFAGVTSVHEVPTATVENQHRFLVPFVVSVLIYTALLLLNFDLFHWSAIPIILCGTLIGDAAIRWITGLVDPFDPIGWTSFAGYHLFFLAPLLTIVWSHSLPFMASQPDDYRPFLGGMAALNVLGLSAFLIAYRYLDSRPYPKEFVEWRINPSLMNAACVILMVISGAAQLYVYSIFGGISGYIAAYENWTTGAQDLFAGKGWLFAISESFPSLTMMVVSLILARDGKRRSWLVISLVLLLQFCLLILFGGLRGSRSNTVWNLLWSVGVIHFIVRPLPKRFFLWVMPCLFMFVYLYGFYKNLGSRTTDVILDGEAREIAGERLSRSPRVVVLEDFSRSTIQAFVLWRFLDPNNDFTPAYGLTYTGAVCLVVPRAVWPDRPPAKVRWTTELEYGTGSWRPGGLQSSRVFGLVGEAMLNFGPWLSGWVFLFLAWFVAKVRRFWLHLSPFDSRRLILPLFVLSCPLVLLNDLDVVMVFTMKYMLLPCAVVFLCSQRTRCLRMPVQHQSLLSRETRSA